jgi:hypothetical protein
MKRQPIWALGIIAGLLFMATASQALLPNFTKEELIQKSEVIVLGTIQEMNSSWSVDHSQIYTYVVFGVEAQFKGRPVGQEITIQIPGGTADGITQWVSDVPHLEPGMRVILHTFMQDTGYPWIYGWEKGVLQVENDVIPDYNMTVDQFRQLVEKVEE